MNFYNKIYQKAEPLLEVITTKVVVRKKVPTYFIMLQWYYLPCARNITFIFCLKKRLQWLYWGLLPTAPFLISHATNIRFSRRGDAYLKVNSAKNHFLPWNRSFYLKKKCLLLTILRFLCSGEIRRFQNLWRHHRHCYKMEVTLMLISFES